MDFMWHLLIQGHVSFVSVTKIGSKAVFGCWVLAIECFLTFLQYDCHSVHDIVTDYNIVLSNCFWHVPLHRKNNYRVYIVWAAM